MLSSYSSYKFENKWVKGLNAVHYTFHALQNGKQRFNPGYK